MDNSVVQGPRPVELGDGTVGDVHEVAVVSRGGIESEDVGARSLIGISVLLILKARGHVRRLSMILCRLCRRERATASGPVTPVVHFGRPDDGTSMTSLVLAKRVHPLVLDADRPFGALIGDGF
jgi:hypothetical protein